MVARLPVGEAPCGTLKKEAALLRVVAERVPVPKLVDEAPDGHGYLTGFVNWRELEDDGPTGERVGAVLRALQQSVPFEHAGMFNETLRVAEPFSSALAGLREWAEGCLERRAANRLGAKRTAAIRALWDAHEAELDAPPVLCHADYKPWNLKWDTDREDVVVFDWEFAWAGPPLFDIGMMLRWGTSPNFEQGLARGYRAAGGQLPENWRRLADVYDLFNMVGFLDSEASHPRREADVLARTDKTLAAT